MFGDWEFSSKMRKKWLKVRINKLVQPPRLMLNLERWRLLSNPYPLRSSERSKPWRPSSPSTPKQDQLLTRARSIPRDSSKEKVQNDSSKEMCISWSDTRSSRNLLLLSF
ncbi:hypothetical protein PENTCL1PPCAC_18669 [Pristionchus entomophagus]|uniref:Ribosomal protein n=1 Tax=Pristionchus entomophagus TaxID=358040 RepID=A0AAV5TQ09_9BILA|nr:hypothetical protein PENTCL1PPCAC_18669 [Pristionchus entomophagus]